MNFKRQSFVGKKIIKKKDNEGGSGSVTEKDERERNRDFLEARPDRYRPMVGSKNSVRQKER